MNQPTVRRWTRRNRNESVQHDERYLVENFQKVQRRTRSGCPVSGGFATTNVAAALFESPKAKDPSGGTTGRVEPYGRLGWMGARAEYSLRWGGMIAPTKFGRASRSRRSNMSLEFLNVVVIEKLAKTIGNHSEAGLIFSPAGWPGAFGRSGTKMPLTALQPRD